MIKEHQKINNTQGFTLVETLISISIFTLALLVVMVSLGKSINDTQFAKGKITAEYLAQENIEYIRNMRDTYLLYYDPINPQNGWNAFLVKLSGCTSTNGSKTCYIDDQGLSYTDSTLPMTDLSTPVCSGSCPNLKYDSTTGRYSYNGSGVDSGFKRWFAMTQNPGDPTIKIYSYVTPARGSTVIFTEDLKNWGE